MIMDYTVKDWLQEWCYLIDKGHKQQTNKTEIRISSVSINGKDVEETEEINDIMEFEFPKW